jgi:D-inositol-3-phosphate glycosyltransferase
MRIAMLSVHTSPMAALGGKETGGMNVYVRELCREMGRRGVLVDIYTRKQDPSLPKVAEVWPGVRIINLPAGPVMPYPKGDVYLHLDEFVRGIEEVVLEEGIRYDIYHAHYWLSGLVAERLRAKWDAPVVQMFHTLGRMKDAVARSQAEREVAVRSEEEERIVQFADQIVAATPLDKEQTVQLYGANPDKIVVIPCGVDPEMFYPVPRELAKAEIGGPVSDCRMILFVGRLDPVKGLDTLLEAMCHLTRQSDPEHARKYCLVVVGGDKESAAELLSDTECLEDIRESYDLPDLVMFMGSQTQEMLAHYYAAAEFVVIPSRYESFGMVALEAMACGTPVIASRVGGLTFTVQDGVNGFLVPDQDPDALAAKMSLLLNDPDLRDRLGEQALDVTHRYTWGRIAGEILDLYGRLLAIPVGCSCCCCSAE